MNRKPFQLAIIAAATLLALVRVSATPETLLLSNGTSLVGEVTSEAGGKIVFQDAVLGTLTIDAAAVKARHPYNANTTAAAVPHTTTPPVVPKPGQPATDPTKPHWTRGVQFNYSYISAPAPDLGIGSTTNYGASLALERASTKNIASFTASLNWSRSRPGPVSVDNQTYGFEYDRIFSPQWRFISRSTYMIDHPKKIDHRFQQLAAIGHTFVQSPKVFFLVAPGVGYSDGSKEFVGNDEQHFGYGAYETLTYNFTPTLSLEQHFIYFGAFDTADYYVYSGALGLKGQLTRMLSMSIGWSFDRDNHMAPGIAKSNSMLTSGLQVKF